MGAAAARRPPRNRSRKRNTSPSSAADASDNEPQYALHVHPSKYAHPVSPLAASRTMGRALWGILTVHVPSFAKPQAATERRRCISEVSSIDNDCRVKHVGNIQFRDRPTAHRNRFPRSPAARTVTNPAILAGTRFRSAEIQMTSTTTQSKSSIPNRYSSRITQPAVQGASQAMLLATDSVRTI